MKSRPAETGGAVAAAVAVLIAWAAQIKDATVVAAMAVVVGFIPAAITWVVSTARKPAKHKARGERGYGVIELLFAILLVIVLVWLIVFFASRI